MIMIEDTNKAIKVTGHAKREVCAMTTALTMAFVQNAEAETSEPVPYKVEDGYFYCDTSLMKTGKAIMLARCLRRNLQTLAKEYPSMVQYVRIDT
jgi:uncharacterized protein YsxB (DUF464 family)